MKLKTKSRRIAMLLAEGLDTEQICLRTGATKALVSVIRCRGKPHRTYHGTDEYVSSQPVRMVIGPWSRDAAGNLTREIRGE